MTLRDSGNIVRYGLFEINLWGINHFGDAPLGATKAAILDD